MEHSHGGQVRSNGGLALFGAVLFCVLCSGCMQTYREYTRFDLGPDRVGYAVGARLNTPIRIIIRDLDADAVQTRKRLAELLAEADWERIKRDWKVIETPFVADDYARFCGVDDYLIARVSWGADSEGRSAWIRTYGRGRHVFGYIDGRWQRLGFADGQGEAYTRDVWPICVFKDAPGSLHMLAHAEGRGIVDLELRGTQMMERRILMPDLKEHRDLFGQNKLAVSTWPVVRCVRVSPPPPRWASERVPQGPIEFEVRTFDGNEWGPHPVAFRLEADILAGSSKWAWDLSRSGDLVYVFVCLPDAGRLISLDRDGKLTVVGEWRDSPELRRFSPVGLCVLDADGGIEPIVTSIDMDLTLCERRPCQFKLGEDGVKKITDPLSTYSCIVPGLYSGPPADGKSKKAVEARTVELMRLAPP